MDVLNLINDYIKDENYRGLLSKLNHNPKLKASVWNLINSRFGSVDSLSEGIYLVANNLKERPVCKCCGGSVNYKNLNIGYFKMCSSKCAQSSKETRDKIKKTCIKKYGVSHHTKTDEYRQYISDKCKHEGFGFGGDSYKEYLIKHNVENVSQIPEVYERIMKTIKSRTKEEQVNN